MKPIFLTFSAMLLASLAVVQAAESRPNIVFIMADDQAPWAFAASGYAQAKTPNIDRIAREGARFPNAFTPTPVCSPARASIMTSRYGSELGITDWINAKVDVGLGLDAKIPTWPKLLQQAGYATALFGKWHLGDLDEQHPTKRGYDTFMGFRGGGTPPKDPVLEKDGISAKRDGFIVDIVADEAIAWLKKRDQGQPFAVSIHFREPHAAYLPVREEDWAQVKELDPAIPNPDLPGLDTQRVKKLTREYLASVAAIDRNLGHLLETLDALKLTENTLVIYTSDHGYNLGHHGLLYKGNAQRMTSRDTWPAATGNIPAVQRPNMFDTSVKIPLVIRWPGVISSGTVNPHTVSHLDWLPTFARLGAASIPAGTIVRGRDIVPLLRGQAKEWDDDYYAQYSMKHGAAVHLRMYRTAEWKLIRDFNNEGRDELYHLALDPEETRNLIHDPSPEAKKAITDLDARLRAKMEEIKDPVIPLARQRLGWFRPEVDAGELKAALRDTGVSPRWIYHDLTTARAQAHQSGQPLLVLFRCVPCGAAPELDQQITTANSPLAELLDQFVCVRVVKMNGVDRNTFAFDHDLPYAAMFLNADGTVYGRYGSRDGGTRSQLPRFTVQSFRKSLQRVLELHAGYPGNRLVLAEKIAAAASPAFPEDMPTMKPFPNPPEAKNCIHCHMVGEATLQQALSNRPLTSRDLWPYPVPDRIGLRLDVADGLRVGVVTANSPAETAGLRPGDELVRMNGQALASEADVQWVLHHLPDEAQLNAAVLRDGQKMDFAVTLSGLWRKASSHWRQSLSPARPNMLLRPDPFKGKKGIEAGKMGLLVVYPRATTAAAGLRSNDLLIAVDGRTDLHDESDVLHYLHIERRDTRTVEATVLRQGQTLKIPLPVR